jgi:hypothetical protein
MVPIKGRTMNDNMRKVLVALRSGEYEQGVEALQCGNAYCCLGVMCAVYERETGAEIKRTERGHIEGDDLDDQEGVAEWVGLAPYKSGASNPQGALIDLNDDENYTFSQIADFIESEPRGLLV